MKNMCFFIICFIHYGCISLSIDMYLARPQSFSLHCNSNAYRRQGFNAQMDLDRQKDTTSWRRGWEFWSRVTCGPSNSVLAFKFPNKKEGYFCSILSSEASSHSFTLRPVLTFTNAVMSEMGAGLERHALAFKHSKHQKTYFPTGFVLQKAGTPPLSKSKPQVFQGLSYPSSGSARVYSR